MQPLPQRNRSSCWWLPHLRKLSLLSVMTYLADWTKDTNAPVQRRAVQRTVRCNRLLCGNTRTPQLLQDEASAVVATRQPGRLSLCPTKELINAVDDCQSQLHCSRRGSNIQFVHVGVCHSSGFFARPLASFCNTLKLMLKCRPRSIDDAFPALAHPPVVDRGAPVLRPGKCFGPGCATPHVAPVHPSASSGPCGGPDHVGEAVPSAIVSS